MKSKKRYTMRRMNANIMLAFMPLFWLPVCLPLNAQIMDTVLIRIIPDTILVREAEMFEVMVEIDADTLPIDGAGIHLDFDPEILEVVSLEGNLSVFPVILENLLSNENGTIDYSAGTFSNFPTGKFPVMTITFLAREMSNGTELEFAVPDFPRETSVTSGGFTLPASLESAYIRIDPLSTMLDGSEARGTLSDITIFPNPNASGTLHFNIDSPGTGDLTVALFDFEGSTVAHRVLNSVPGAYSRTWHIDPQPKPGPYICRVTTNSFTSTRLIYFIE